jgi:hypothetical protein
VVAPVAPVNSAPTSPAVPFSLKPALAEHRRQLDQFAAEADAFVGTLDDDQFHWQPRPGAWSVAECLEHLNVTARVVLPRIDDAIADAVRRGVRGGGRFVLPWADRLVLRSTEPPSRWPMRSPAALRPAPLVPRDQVMSALRDHQQQFIARLQQANGLDLGRARVTSIASRWVRFPLGTGFALIAAHQRRHLWQALSVSSIPGFPAAPAARP